MSKRVPPRAATHVPAVQKLRIRYAKRGRLRFASHRDFQRALERALRRAEVPMAYSAGFSPHPRVSYANAAPTGVASEAEYLEIGVVRECDPERLRLDLDAALPPGLDIVEIVVARTSDLAQRLEASQWAIALPGVSLIDAQRAVERLLRVESARVQRMTKKGRREVDVRESLLAAEVHAPETSDVSSAADGPGECAILRVVVRSVTPTVRPDDVLAALRSVADLVPPIPPRVTREMQGPLAADGCSVGDPLAPDRDDAAGQPPPLAPSHPEPDRTPKT